MVDLHRALWRPLILAGQSVPPLLLKYDRSRLSRLHQNRKRIIVGLELVLGVETVLLEDSELRIKCTLAQAR